MFMFSYDTQISFFELKEFDQKLISLNSQTLQIISITFSLCSCSKLDL